MCRKTRIRAEQVLHRRKQLGRAERAPQLQAGQPWQRQADRMQDRQWVLVGVEMADPASSAGSPCTPLLLRAACWFPAVKVLEDSGIS